MFVVHGDLLKLAKQGEFDIIVHGCNCFCTMGGGIAKQIRDQFPEAYAADCATRKGDRAKLGQYTSATVNGLTIVNAYTQYNYNRSGKPADLFDYEAFAYILNDLALAHPDKRFGFPLIGTGLAGGDVVTIVEMLEMFSTQIEAGGGSVTLVDFDNK
jgi:O-acetyl-ADP-ribose deacetylase (regulator of RNase III)